MRTREEITEAQSHKATYKHPEYLILEVLLDIRDLLSEAPKEPLT
jgi:hypothetical protein